MLKLGFCLSSVGPGHFDFRIHVLADIVHPYTLLNKDISLIASFGSLNLKLTYKPCRELTLTQRILNPKFEP